MSIILATVLYFRKKRSDDPKIESIRLNSSCNDDDPTRPPTNGPVGADQIHPYEVQANEVANRWEQRYGYKAPKVDTYEIDDRNAVLRDGTVEKVWLPGGKDMRAGGGKSPRTPAPTYQEAMMPAELE